MNKREDRLNTLREAGIETGNFYAMDVPEGATIIIATPDGKQMKYDKNGNRIDEILKKVKDIGYIKEDPHFRRWVMAQTFDILNYKGSFKDFIRYHKGGYMYQFEQTLNELEAIEKMPVNSEARRDRTQFFTKHVVVALCEDYIKKLRAYVDALPVKNHKGIPYKKVKGFGLGVHCKDIEGVVFQPLEKPFMAMNEGYWNETDYKRLAKLLAEFKDHMIKPDMWEWDLCDAWVSAYKGVGAYYTLMGLIKFHDCRVYEYCSYRWDPLIKLDLDGSIRAVKEKVKEIKMHGFCSKYDWYLLYGMMKEVIKDNKFDFRAKMKEIYEK